MDDGGLVKRIEPKVVVFEEFTSEDGNGGPRKEVISPKIDAVDFRNWYMGVQKDRAQGSVLGPNINDYKTNEYGVWVPGS